MPSTAKQDDASTSHRAWAWLANYLPLPVLGGRTVTPAPRKWTRRNAASRPTFYRDLANGPHEQPSVRLKTDESWAFDPL